jgi:hypothetical protein
MNLLTWAQNFTPGHEPSYLYTKLQTWAQNFKPGHETSYQNIKLCDKPFWKHSPMQFGGQFPMSVGN